MSSEGGDVDVLDGLCLCAITHLFSTPYLVEPLVRFRA